MKVTPLCISCALLRRSLELESIYEDKDNATRLSIMRELLEAINLYIGPDIEAAELVTVSFRRLRALTPQVTQLYEALVASSMKMAADRARNIRSTIEGKKLSDIAEFLLVAAAAATGFKLLSGQWRLLDEPPTQLDVINIRKGRLDTDKFIDLVYKAANSSIPVYYLFGSAYELPYDALLIEKLVNEDVRVVGVARRERFEDYATVHDLDSAGVSDYLDDVVEIEAAAAPSEDDSHIIGRMNDAPFVVVKGGVQSLYFHNNPLKTSMVFMFTAVCPVLVKLFNVSLNSVNAIVVE